MRIAHIIMAHKYPDQLLRLVRRIDHPFSNIFVHVDKKTDIKNFKYIQKEIKIHFIVNRKTCNWGGNSFVEGIVSSLREVLQEPWEYDYINLISAQDYPLMTSEQIYKFLLAKKGTNFISYELTRDSDWWRDAVTRYQNYHFTDLKLKGKYFVQKIVNKLFSRKTVPALIELYGGSKSSWWTITGDCAKYLSQELQEGNEFWRFLKYSWGTDEFAIATVIMNSEFRNKTTNNNLRYIDWSEGNAHPKVLRTEDFDLIRHSGMMFARKFDLNVDSEILDVIDKTLLCEDQKA